MIVHRPFATLGRSLHGWLDARHHFSIATYHDPERMGWGALRVWNDDEIAPQAGFPMHLHRDMEIVTYVRRGAITHEDSLGNRGRTEAGCLQVMSAGRGISHSEFNREDEPTALFQLWIRPREEGLEPRWASCPVAPEGTGPFQVLASGFGDAGALELRADARVLRLALQAGRNATYSLAPDASVYAVLAGGAATLNGLRLGERDGAALSDESCLDVAAIEDCELLLVESL